LLDAATAQTLREIVARGDEIQVAHQETIASFAIRCRRPPVHLVHKRFADVRSFYD